jgi:hypothetical protein
MIWPTIIIGNNILKNRNSRDTVTLMNLLPVGLCHAACGGFTHKHVARVLLHAGSRMLKKIFKLNVAWFCHIWIFYTSKIHLPMAGTVDIYVLQVQISNRKTKEQLSTECEKLMWVTSTKVAKVLLRLAELRELFLIKGNNFLSITFFGGEALEN